MGMLSDLDLTKQIKSKKLYEKLLKKYQYELLEVQRRIIHGNFKVILLFEGWDAAGKGGCIKRLTEVWDSRHFKVNAISAPTPTEKAHHYLWRFWTHIPEQGQVAIFDRSWYGRVMVERIENFCTPEEWKRAYDEINNFEKALADDNTIIIKFFLHISKAEQKRRFEGREQEPLKRWKITKEDWRNRTKWNKYLKAAEEMIKKTNKRHATWNIVSAEHKRYARIHVIKTVIRRFYDALGEPVPDMKIVLRELETEPMQ